MKPTPAAAASAAYSGVPTVKPVFGGDDDHVGRLDVVGDDQRAGVTTTASQIAANRNAAAVPAAPNSSPATNQRARPTRGCSGNRTR